MERHSVFYNPHSFHVFGIKPPLRGLELYSVCTVFFRNYTYLTYCTDIIYKSIKKIAM